MKYKLEFWPYGEFETEEAAERLNRRASEGWELVNIANVFFNMVLYRRNPAAIGYRYTADIVPATEGHDEEYVAFCADAGWEKIAAMDNGFCIFVSRDGSGRPLHTNKEVQLERQLEVLEENHVSVSVVPYVLEIAFLCAFWTYMFYFEYSLSLGKEILWFFPAFIITAIGGPLLYSINLAYVKHARRHCAEGEIVQRPGWLAKLYGGLSALSVILFAGVCVWCLSVEIKEGISPALVIISNSLFLIFTALSIWLKLFRKNSEIGGALIFLAFIFLMAPLFLSGE